MRAGGCSVQESLTPEAAAVVRQAINLARRRGHAQVTPLHVANTMLSSSTGLLRAACLQSHSHPLQCKALELCFNVALNRLPASTLSSPLLAAPSHPHLHHIPSLSNALVAAFKRAQAHQRRGSVESQQQPLLAIKIELEQLIISILDDPSVSRVMREAGFSSILVKSNVEQAVSSSSSSMDICSPSPPPHPNPNKPKELISRAISPVQVKREDVMCVLDALASKRKRSLVVVGECLASAEAVLGGVMERVEKGEVPQVLRSLQFIPIPLSSFRQMPLEEVDHKVGELRCLVKSCCAERGAVLCLKDLNWAAEFGAGRGDKGRSYNYCPLEHVIMEIRNLLCGGFEGVPNNGRLWLLGSATYQTYMRCRVGNPSLETLWSLQPLTIPTGSLGLSLNCDSDLSLKTSKITGGVQFLLSAEDEIRSHLSCCADCSINFEMEAQSLCNTSQNGSHGSISSSLPSWLRQYKKENKRGNNNDQGCLRLKDLCKKWNSICSSSHKSHHHPSEITFNFSSVSPSSSTISSYDRRFPSLHQNQQPWLLSLDQPNEHFSISEAAAGGAEHKYSRFKIQDYVEATSRPNSTSSSGTMEIAEYLPRFKELNAENLKTICIALERRVPDKQDIIPDIASAILQCRSGLIRRKDKSKSSSDKKEEAWLFFQGNDAEGKERIARELAGIVFGSYASLITIGLSNFSSTRSVDGSTDDLRNKRSRAEASHSYTEGIFKAVRENPHRVIVMEDIEQVDSRTRAGIKRSMERGKIQSLSGAEVSLSDAIIILSCESFDSRSRACSPPVKQKGDQSDDDENEVGACLSLDLNLCAHEEEDEDFFDNGGLVEAADRAFFFRLAEEI
ncbi:hypothetical protein Cni_G20633 [Canna indica]|uniref:Clp R domain-containing protein n=1 Tax=Canna indica TaxID=4628 RepID=A0AAQ3KPB8_9LILI|nr:hypothetical protein Cni_G20633 [Canna indica]